MERKCCSSCHCQRCSTAQNWRFHEGDHYINNNSNNNSRNISSNYNWNSTNSSSPPSRNYHAASYAKAENRVRFDTHHAPPPPLPPQSTNHRPDNPSQLRGNSYGYTNALPHAQHHSTTCEPQQQQQQQLQHQQHRPTCELQQQLHRQTNIIREQKRELDELRSRMVIPVLPDPSSTMHPRLLIDDDHHHMSPFEPVDPSAVDRSVRSVGSTTVGRGFDSTAHRTTHQEHRLRDGCRRSRGLNRNNNNDRYSETDSDTYASEEDQDYFDEDFEYEDDSPLIRKGGNNNVNNDVNNDETNNPRHGQTTPSSAITAPATQTDVLLVQDRCCGTCCAIAAVVTCAVLVILVVYPIVYLLKHSSIHI